MHSPVWHPFTQHGLREPIPLVERAKGARLYTRDGRTIIDGISSWWVTTHGHCHPRIAAAIAEQAQRLDQIIFAGFTHEPAEDLARDLVRLVSARLDDEGRSPTLPHVFFSDSGSTSVEVALKMALGHWVHRGEVRHRILVLDRGYHGDTIGAMSVGARGVFNQPYAPLLFDVQSMPFPDSGNEHACLDALERACQGQGADGASPAAFIVEPLILGAGGMAIYAPGVLKAMREICRRHGVLFIADEIMTGWGRTGTVLACEQAGVTPDILCLSKGLTGGAVPLAVTMASASVFDAHCSTDRARQFFHSSSYTANPIACAAANANLAIWREEPVMERIGALTMRQGEGLARLARMPGVGGARQIGTIIALDLEVADGGYLAAVGPQLLAHFRERDVLLRPLGNTIYVMPPYGIEPADLDTLHEAIAEAIIRVQARQT